VGYVDLLLFALLAGTSLPLAGLGVCLAHRLPEQQLRLALFLLMLFVGAKMLGLLEWLRP
jgi:uncharacterized membrane protein YfcA